MPFSPRVALIYSPSAHLNVKYIFNQGYLAPAPFMTYSVFDAGFRINTINPDLQPERATSNEININYTHKRLSLGSAFYYNQQRNLFFLGDAAVSRAAVVQDTVWTDLEGKQPRRLTRQVNSGASTSYGTDLFAKYQAEKLSLWASFSYVHFERDLGVEKTGLNRISPVNVRFGFSWMPVKKLTITPSLIYRTTPPNYANTFGLDEEIKNPYEVNAYVAYQPVRGLTVFLNGRNVTNHRYALKGNTSPSPQEPIRFYGGIRYILQKQ
jgi:outer membrane receptor protein involved in Fe transport